MTKLSSEIGFKAIGAGIRMPALKPLQAYWERSYLIDLMKRLNVNCYFDVGANNGWTSHNLRKMGFQGHIFSFEPILENFKKLEQQTIGDKKWKALNIALGSENTTKTFNIFGQPGEAYGSVFSSFRDITIDLDTEMRSVEMTVNRLDDIASDLLEDVGNPRVFLKMDTQGYDLEVLRGATDTLNSVVGLQSEISVTPIYEDMPHYTDALTYNENLGFSLMNLFLVNRTKKGSILEYDCLMAKLNELN